MIGDFAQQGFPFARSLRGGGVAMAPWGRCAMALGLAAFAFGARLALLPKNGGYEFLFTYPAVTLCAFVFGAGPGLLAVAFSAALACYIFLPQFGSSAIEIRDLLPVAMFGLCGLLICWLAHVMHRSTEELQSSETKLRALSDELRQSRADLEMILDNVPARISFWDANCANRFMNRAAEQAFPLTATEARGIHVSKVIGTERYDRAKPFIEAALCGARQSHEPEEPQADGSSRYSRVEYIPQFKNGIVAGLYVVAIDVTEARESYDRLRKLVQRLETAHEDDRRSAAVALHEGIAQDLFAARFSLMALETLTSRHPALSEVSKNLSVAIDSSIKSTRQVAEGLRPSILVRLPLSAALREYARSVGDTSGLSIEVVEDGSFPLLDEATRLVFFRAAQEALTNIVRHSQATRVTIALGADATYSTMCISDDGIGIAERDLKKTGSLGLLEIRERFDALGGGLQIEQGEPTGTKKTMYLRCDTC